jgi:GTP-binding protein EngB required for normal cell division
VAAEETTPSTGARFGRVRNNLKMGIVGLPNVGKSSLFNLLTAQVDHLGDQRGLARVAIRGGGREAFTHTGGSALGCFASSLVVLVCCDV